MGAVLLVAHSSGPNPGQRKEGGVGLPCAPFAEATAASNDSSPVDGAGRRDGVFADGGRLVRRRSLREAVGEEKPSSGIIKLGAGSGWAQDLLGPRAGRSSTGRVMTERIQECRAPSGTGWNVGGGQGQRSRKEAPKRRRNRSWKTQQGNLRQRVHALKLLLSVCSLAL